MTKICVRAAIWAGMVGSLGATEISYAPLNNILKAGRWIIEAQVVSVSCKNPPEANRVEYFVVPTAVVMGLSTTPGKATLAYAETNPVLAH